MGADSEVGGVGVVEGMMPRGKKGYGMSWIGWGSGKETGGSVALVLITN